MNAPRWFWYVVAGGVIAVGGSQIVGVLHDVRRGDWSMHGTWAIVEAKTGTVCRLLFDPSVKPDAELECIRYDRGLGTIRQLKTTYPGNPFGHLGRGTAVPDDPTMDTGMRMDTLPTP